MDEKQPTIDRNKIIKTTEQILDFGTTTLAKEKVDSEDLVKLRVIRSLDSTLKVALGMVQVEVAQDKIKLLASRMKALGFDPPKELIG